jgi:hypothetical protein
VDLVGLTREVASYRTLVDRVAAGKRFTPRATQVLPPVLGFNLTGALAAGVTATDLVLTVVAMLRAHGVVVTTPLAIQPFRCAQQHFVVPNSISNVLQTRWVPTNGRFETN